MKSNEATLRALMVAADIRTALCPRATQPTQVTLALSVVTSSAAFVAEKTLTLAVQTKESRSSARRGQGGCLVQRQDGGRDLRRQQGERQGAHDSHDQGGLPFRAEGLSVAIWVSPQQDRTSGWMTVMLLLQVIALEFYRPSLH
jgi:hypothetical protein